ncbi:MAG: SPFH domain-containing protein [Candidatus Helarchaeota archaeon]|nr:SPFH domain-containing protein [Candidatus Helarchaeota archaeon]
MGRDWKLGWEHEYTPAELEDMRISSPSKERGRGKEIIKRFFCGRKGKDVPKGDKNVLVREGEACVYYRDGKIYDVLGAGRHKVDDKFFLVSDYAYVDLGLMKIKFGLPEGQIMSRDRIPMSSYGNITIQIEDPKIFLTNLVSGQPKYYESDLRNWVRDEISEILGSALSKMGSMDVYTQKETFESITRVKSREMFNEFGIKFIDLNLISVKLPDEIEKAYTKKVVSVTDAEAEITRYKMLQEAGISALDMEKIKAMQEFAKRKGGGIGTIYDSQVLANIMGPIKSDTAKTRPSESSEVVKIRELMLKLDEKLMDGSISEERYDKMMTRYKNRLKELGAD